MAALAILVAAVWPLPQPAFFDYAPTPDAPEYLAGAVSLAHDGQHAIEIAGEKYPSRYPIGFSAAIAPFLACGVEPKQAPFVVSALAGLHLLILVFATLWICVGSTAAGLGALLLATTPAFVVLARAPMAELTASLWTTAGVVLCFVYVHRGRLWQGTIGALFLGLATIFRLGNLFFAPIVLLSLLAVRGQVKRPLLHTTVILLALAAGCLPVLLSQWVALGDPLATGYAFWIPDHASISSSFGFSHLFDNLRYLARDFAQLEWKTTVATYYGTGSYFGPASLVILALCLGRALRTPCFRWPAIGVAAYALMMLAYFFQDARFFFALVPLAAVLVAWQSVEMLRSSTRPLKVVVAILLGLHCLGIPGPGLPSELPELLAPSQRDPTWRFELIDGLRDKPPGLVFSTFSPPYGKALLGESWTVSPARDVHDYMWSSEFVFRGPERQTQMRKFVAAGNPIYLVADVEFAAALAETAPLDGHVWITLSTTGNDGGTAELRSQD